jgi:hypothetical protein
VARRTAACLALAASLVALCAPAANADLIGNLIGNNCPTSGAQVFSPWGDSRSYYLAPNGGLESGANGWTLSGGATVASGNQPFFKSGSYSLSLPTGSRALSPATCIGPYALSLRMFGSDAGGRDGGVHVRVLWYGLLNKLLGTTDYVQARQRLEPDRLRQLIRRVQPAASPARLDLGADRADAGRHGQLLEGRRRLRRPLGEPKLRV